MKKSSSPFAIAKRSFSSSLQTIRGYSRTKFRHDLLAGLTVSVVEIPQAMAYALIAGVPPQYGLYTSVIQGVIGALLSSSEHLATGPTNTQSLLIAATVQRLGGDPQNPIYLELVLGLTLLKGAIQLLFAFARMGNLVRYIGRSVILGISSGAGALILIGQLPNFLGIRLTALETQHTLPGILANLYALILHFHEINYRALLVGLGCLAVIGLCRVRSRFIPGSLFAIIASAALVGGLGWTDAELAQIGDLPRSLPSIHVPMLTFGQAEALLPGALALALLGLIESVAIVKTIAVRTGESIDPNQEFFAQGFKNTVTSFMQCIPGSGSFTRSALDYAAGGKTRFAAVFNAMFVALIYLAFAPAARCIPLASLSAVLFVIAWSLIDWPCALRTIRTSKAEGAVFVLTLLTSLLAPLQYAVFVGMFLSLSLYLRQASQLHITELVHSPSGLYLERPLGACAGDQPVKLLQIEGDLFFAVADELAGRLTALTCNRKLRLVILRLKRTHLIDTTVLHTLEQFVQQMQSRGGHVLLCGVKPELKDTLDRFGLIALVGKENVFEASLGGFASAKCALARATELIGRSIVTEEADIANITDEWSYEI